jgi:malate permease and related proteins
VNNVFEVLTQNIFPIFIVAALGYALRRWLAVDKKALSTAVFYALSPCLVFGSLVNSQLPGDELLQLALFAFVSILAMGMLGLLAGRLFRLTRSETVALVLVLMFVNGGNYGLTFNNLRYGSEGLARAVVYFVTSTVLVFTVGVFIASLANHGRSGWRRSVASLLRLPPLYAVILALLVYATGLVVPGPLMRAIEVAGAGAIPVMLLVLGMQMADMTGLAGVRLAVPATLMRLALGPVVAVLVAALLGIEGLSRSVSILEASMPTAVIAIILATEYDVQPAAVTSTVVASTLLSVVSLPLVIYFLGL